MTGQLKQPNRNLLGWLLALILMLILFMSACSPEYYQNKYCPKTSVKDSIHVTEKDSMVPRDSIVYIPKDSIVLKDSVPCGDFKKEFKGDRSYIKVEVKDSVMTATCVCDEIEIKLQWYEYWHKKIIEKFHSEVRVLKGRKPLPWWFWFGLGALSVVIIWQRKRILGLFIKLIKPL